MLHADCMNIYVCIHLCFIQICIIQIQIVQMQIAYRFAVFFADALVTSVAAKPLLFVIESWTKKTPLAFKGGWFVHALDNLSLWRKNSTAANDLFHNMGCLRCH